MRIWLTGAAARAQSGFLFQRKWPGWDRLEKLDQRKANLIELRFFLALTMEETAEVLSISLSTAERDLKFSRSWLFHELRSSPAGELA